MRVKVFGGLHSGRVLILPRSARAGDFISLPDELPAGRMFQSGRTTPDEHMGETTYKLRESAARPGALYLSYVENAPRFITSVSVPQRRITITL